LREKSEKRKFFSFEKTKEESQSSLFEQNSSFSPKESLKIFNVIIQPLSRFEKKNSHFFNLWIFGLQSTILLFLI